MCGIYFCCGKNRCKNEGKLSARGPDQKKIIECEDYTAIFHRLAIFNTSSEGLQPFIVGKTVLLCNGEIYNYDSFDPDNPRSDCECIAYLYNAYGIEFTVNVLNGEFAFIIYDTEKKLIHFARDRLGRKPLFYEKDAISSLLCCLDNGIQVIPGNIYTYDVINKILSIQPYHTFIYKPIGVTDYDIKRSLINAVSKRCHQSDRPIGFLLSGGFDSSLILSIALSYGMVKNPHVFTIGFSEDAPDIKSATKMVDYLKKYQFQWHKVILPIEEGIKAIPEVIEVLETYDTTTVRASTPMYLISKYIKERTDVRVILSGEGSDELFGGYLYFNYAPNDQAFRAEILKLLRELYLYDVLRADRTTASQGLEIRTPFLDDELVTSVLRSDKLKKGKLTKQMIRDIVDNTLLPDEIRLGKKEAFSDAVSLGWKDAIVSHSAMIGMKESEWYRSIFKEKFGDIKVLPKLWLPNQDWVHTGDEPSARVLSVY